ncbi:hypothetical protein Pelo_10667 [Pelomyxa schiedti]|nr:hypothetical protein Pelo_10667 [Pelomyxa schiedti]
MPLLEPFRIAVDICQRDGGHLLDAAIAYKKLLSTSNKICQQWPDSTVPVQAVMKEMLHKFEASRIFDFTRCLMPKARLGKNLEAETFSKGSMQMLTLVAEKYPQWMKRGLLPVSSKVPRAELTSQLSKHVSKTDPIQLGCAKTELAILLCGVAATEADCERVFSWEGYVHNSYRNALDPALTEKLVFIHYNFEKIFNYKPLPQAPPPATQELDNEE